MNYHHKTADRDPAAGLPRLCFVSYRQIRQMALPIISEYRDRAEIEVVDGSFDVALDLARERLERGQVDAFVSAGSNASLLRSGLSAPVATIQLSGFDILQALIRARETADRVGIVMYGQTLPALDSVKSLLNVDLRQYAYHTPDSARACIQQLRSDGIDVVVGSSLVVELAENAGLTGLLAYSRASIRQGFEDALELARVARLESGRYDQLNTVLHTLQDAVLAVNQSEQIIAINPAMQRILGLSRAPRLGTPLTEVTSDVSLRPTLEHGQAEQGVVLRLKGRDWIANRTPIREHGRTTGAALTLYDASAIHEADNSLRIQHRRSDHEARHRFENLKGTSPALLRAIASAQRYAATPLNVLITGESGTGKELFAQAIHNAGPRASRPFVAINCAAFPEALLESELFGHEEGAFTGARRGGRRGLFETAHTGTLFLDEIGDMPLTLQTRLLRVLQERRITRLGASRSIPVDVRVIAATHQNLTDLVTQRAFRQDLYYRLNTLRLHLPALRERAEDIYALARHLLQNSLSQLDAVHITPDAILQPLASAMQQYGWPGNVRELENVCDRIAVYVASHPVTETIDWEGLRYECPELNNNPGEYPVVSIGNATAPVPTMQAANTAASTDRKRGQSEHALAVLAQHGGRPGAAAAALGISRSTFWRWCRAETTG